MTIYICGQKPCLNLFKRLKYPRLFLVGCVFVSGFTFLYYTNVPTHINSIDAKYIQQTLGSKIVKTSLKSFDDEVKLIKSIQMYVLENIDGSHGIPQNGAREPEDLFKLGYGLCYDKSRTIEKALTIYGFEVRHASVYQIQHDSVFATLIQGQVPSHAVTEVLTSKGWLVVDPNIPWIGLDQEGNPLSLRDIKEKLNKGEVDPDQNPIFHKPFTYLYGVYSRHGKFYPPYIGFPNLNWPQVFYNF